MGSEKTPYDNLDEAALYAEISRRKLAHGIEVWNFPDPGVRRARLIEVLVGNDRLIGLYPQFAKRAHRRPTKSETKPTLLDEITERDLAFERGYEGDL